MAATENWYSRGKSDAEKGIPGNERAVGIGIVVFSILMILHFVAHQMRPTGFFTEAFGPPEMLMLYGAWIFWIISAGLEAILGQRLLSRLFDVLGGLILSGIAIAWLTVVFPFEFAFFSDVLPESFKFLTQWISNDIARVLLVLGVIVHLGAAAYTPIAYKFVDVTRFERDKPAG